MLKGFKNFLMQGNLVIIAVGLVIALAFSALVTAFTTTIITPLINALAGSSSHNQGLGWTINGQRIELGSFISAIIYFVIFMLVIYFVLVVPYRRYMSKRGMSVFATQAAPPPTKTCPECLSTDLPVAATKCLHCASIVS